VKITLDLPEVTLPGSDGYGDPYYHPGVCAGCGYERSDTMAKLAPYGWFHNDGNGEGHGEEPSCLQETVDRLAKNALEIDPHTAWKTVAQHVAKYPSRHSASTIRSVITELLKR
jgi:hypothetical protein